MTYSTKDKKVFIDTMLRARKTPSGLGIMYQPTEPRMEPRFVSLNMWDMFQWMHFRTSEHLSLYRNGSTCARPYIVAHRSSGFPTWHRLVMLWIERQLRKVSTDPDFTLPYWDWVTAKDCDVCTNDFLGGPATEGGDSRIHPNSRFHDWYTICEPHTENSCAPCDPTTRREPLVRDFGRNVTTGLPTSKQLNFVLSLYQYDVSPYNSSAGNTSFRSAMEGEAHIFADNNTQFQMHNHVRSNGSIARSG